MSFLCQQGGACPAGKGIGAEGTGCVNCPLGTYSDGKGSYCESCPPGSISSADDVRSSCVSCLSDQIATADFRCQSCPPNTGPDAFKAACVAPSCTDGLLNGDEEGVDCGGSCEVKCPMTLLSLNPGSPDFSSWAQLTNKGWIAGMVSDQGFQATNFSVDSLQYHSSQSSLFVPNTCFQSDVSLVSPRMEFSAPGAISHIQFWTKVRSERAQDYGVGVVEWAVAGTDPSLATGDLWTSVSPAQIQGRRDWALTKYELAADSTPTGWQKGQDVQIRFRFTADPGVGQPKYAGWWLDDVAVLSSQSVPATNLCPTGYEPSKDSDKCRPTRWAGALVLILFLTLLLVIGCCVKRARNRRRQRVLHAPLTEEHELDDHALETTNLNGSGSASEADIVENSKKHSPNSPTNATSTKKGFLSGKFLRYQQSRQNLDIDGAFSMEMVVERQDTQEDLNVNKSLQFNGDAQHETISEAMEDGEVAVEVPRRPSQDENHDQDGSNPFFAADNKMHSAVLHGSEGGDDGLYPDWFHTEAVPTPLDEMETSGGNPFLASEGEDMFRTQGKAGRDNFNRATLEATYEAMFRTEDEDSVQDNPDKVNIRK
eukprot:g10487.t1